MAHAAIAVWLVAWASVHICKLACYASVMCCAILPSPGRPTATPSTSFWLMMQLVHGGTGPGVYQIGLTHTTMSVPSLHSSSSRRLTLCGVWCRDAAHAGTVACITSLTRLMLYVFFAMQHPAFGTPCDPHMMSPPSHPFTLPCCRYEHLLNLVHSVSGASLLVGGPGTSKTTVINQFLGKFNSEVRVCECLCFCLVVRVAGVSVSSANPIHPGM
jgi:hypothetical protein